MLDRKTTLFLLGLLAAMTIVPLLHSWYTTTDDIYFALGIQEGWRSPGLFDARRSGRFQHAVSGVLMPMAYGWGHYWLMKGLSLAAILSNVAGLFLVLRVITGDARLGLLAVTFFFGFAQNTQDHNLFTAYPLILSLALTLFLLSVASWWATLQHGRRLGVLSVVLYVASLLVYENFLAYGVVFPILTLATTSGVWRDRLLRAVRTPHVAALVAMLVFLVAFRVFFQFDEGREAMAAEEYRLNFDPAAAVEVIERYGAAAMPLHYARTYRNLVNDFYLGYGTFRVRLFEMFEVVEAAWMVKASIVAFLTAVVTLQRGVVRRAGLVWFLGFVFLVLSNLPLAVTAKYQTWVVDNFSHGYLTVYFAFFGVVILLALMVDGAVRAAGRWSRALAGGVAGILAVAAFLTTYGTDFMNAHVALTQRQTYERWQAVDAWIRSPAFAAMPEGSLVLAPSLFERYPGTTYVGDEYWTRYVRHHGRKAVDILHFESDWRQQAQAPGMTGKTYYLAVVQHPRERAVYVVFSPVLPVDAGAPLAAREAWLLMRVRSEHMRLVGRLLDVDSVCRARVLVDDVPSEGTFAEYFATHVDRVRDPDEWRRAHVTSRNGLMAPQSLVLLATSEPLDGSVDVGFDRGFHADEVAHRWAEREATLVLRNRADRDLEVELSFEVKAPGVKDGQRSRLDARAEGAHETWPIGPEPERRSMRVHLPALGSVPVTFSTDAPAEHAPLDLRQLVLMFHRGLRVQEVGCADLEPGTWNSEPATRNGEPGTGEPEPEP